MYVVPSKGPMSHVRGRRQVQWNIVLVNKSFLMSLHRTFNNAHYNV